MLKQFQELLPQLFFYFNQLPVQAGLFIKPWILRALYTIINNHQGNKALFQVMELNRKTGNSERRPGDTICQI
ncbi:hypothetical protein CLOBOL_06304 [Enterocloster bolteae ATCC BAA-613]|uniref:Uncharacterized protein n=2 Tax=Enterocloster bolteae TaxID=208479 RepID=A0A414ASE5_9FIRM|nr:hypothetical protein CLOBOL_06304 [Enterocloster bolteae ATCC BAA-613]RGK74693.1 hypothetical protein DXC96_09940 [Enterocloster bolteae]RGO84560.1 hypothetical protein DXB04_13300 [Enterocloster bolteae]RGQ64330.1 hypothetical protein DWY91_02555 [Enterocloster bolteae]RGS05863.1 hypothetical protein DWY12_22835 [Enterocloster bolteae]